MNKKILFQELDKIKTGIIAIDGPSASGKTTLANELNAKYNWTVIHMDDYFLEPAHRTNDIAGNIDFKRLNDEVFLCLNEAQIKSNHFNCKTNKLEEKAYQKKTDVLVVEGAYSMHPSIIGHYDFKVFLEVDTNKQKERIIERSNAIKFLEFKEKWIPRENLYFDECDVKKQADLIIKEI